VTLLALTLLALTNDNDIDSLIGNQMPNRSATRQPSRTSFNQFARLISMVYAKARTVGTLGAAPTSRSGWIAGGTRALLLALTMCLSAGANAIEEYAVAQNNGYFGGEAGCLAAGGDPTTGHR
jgi:hypothetical protein